MVRDSAWREGRKTEPPDHLIQGTATLRHVGCGSLPRRCPFLPRMGDTWSVARPSMFTFAGGEPAFRALAEAHHRRCLEDPVLAHPFSHPGNPEHVDRLADYWAEVFGGPRRYTESFGGHSAMLELHARTGAEEDLGARFVACFVQAAEDAGLPDDAEFRGPPRIHGVGGRRGAVLLAAGRSGGARSAGPPLGLGRSAVDLDGSDAALRTTRRSASGSICEKAREPPSRINRNSEGSGDAETSSINRSAVVRLAGGDSNPQPTD